MAPSEGNGSTKQRELQGWKEIADYLKRSVRTAQRWEREFDLPVRRLRTAAGETIYAIAEELDDWKARFTRREGFSGDPDDGDESIAVGPSAPGGEGDSPLEDSAPPVVPASPVVKPAALRRSLLLVGGSLFVLALVALAIVLWTRNSAALDPGAVETVAAVLDPGPWPTHAHDMQRTNRSPLPGPRRPAPARVLYLMRGDYVQASDPIVTMNGRILLGWCGEVVGLDLDGRQVWAQSLRAVNGAPVHPSGFSAGSGGTIYFTGADCLNTRDLIETRLYQLSSTGAFNSEQPEIGSSYSAPAIGPDRSVYTVDEVSYLRAFRHWMDAAWGTTLGGFTTTGIAVDGAGNLYVGTDGGVTHEWSLWAVGPNGEIRWSRLKDVAAQPVVGADALYVLTLRGFLHAFTFGGDLRWTRDLGVISSSQPLALGASRTIYVQTGRDLVAVEPKAGGVKWRRGYGACSPHAHPVVDRDENIYVALGDFVVSFTPDGNERWRVAVPRAMTLVLGDRRRLFIVSAENKLYAIDEQ